MRAIPIVLLLSLSAPALAQTPDTTDAARYLPLEVGNVWEYEQWIEECPIFPYCESDRVGYERWVVTGDSVIADTAYATLSVTPFSLAGVPGTPETHLVRFDAIQVRGFRRLPDGRERAWPGIIPCPLDAPIDGSIECGEYDEEYFVEAYSEMEVETAGGTMSRPVKSYYGLITWSEYVADIGLVSSGGAEFGGSWITLTYAYTGAATAGNEQFPVATESVPESAAVALAVFPNPSRGTITIRFSLDWPQRVTLAAYDVLGRRVLTRDLGAQAAGEATHRLDVASLPAGVYVVRLDGDAGATATTRIVRH